MTAGVHGDTVLSVPLTWCERGSVKVNMFVSGSLTHILSRLLVVAENRCRGIARSANHRAGFIGLNQLGLTVFVVVYIILGHYHKVTSEY